MKINISLIIILKNDLDVINTLKSINKQDFRGNVEVIIVDRSNITYPSVKMKYPTKWIKFPKSNKRYTIPEQRNLGITKSKGEVIVFIDASCVADQHWLSEIVKPIQSGSEKVVMGKTGSIGGTTLNDLKYAKLKNTKYSDQAPTINLAIHKSVFETVGIFDERFEYGSDMDFTWRLIDAGYRIRYIADALVSHDWGNYKQELKRAILYGKARPRLYIKHYRTRLHYLWGQDSPTLLYPALILGLPLTFIIPWYPLVFFLLVLKNIREPNPVGIIVKHILYGWGVLIELFQILVKSHV